MNWYMNSNNLVNSSNLNSASIRLVALEFLLGSDLMWTFFTHDTILRNLGVVQCGPPTCPSGMYTVYIIMYIKSGSPEMSRLLAKLLKLLNEPNVLIHVWPLLKCSKQVPLDNPQQKQTKPVRACVHNNKKVYWKKITNTHNKPKQNKTKENLW